MYPPLPTDPAELQEARFTIQSFLQVWNISG
jgi:hypothetical protein